MVKDIEGIDTVLRDTGVYKSEKRDYSSSSLKLKDCHKSKGKLAKEYMNQNRDDKRTGPTCYSSSGKGHMSKDYPSKKDDQRGRGKAVKHKARSNNVEYEQDSIDEV